MDVVSYRGPGVAGGVSSGLGNAWRGHSAADSHWWYVNKNVLEVLSLAQEKAKFIAMLPESLIEGHYKFCNEFIWPLMHDLPQFASYSSEHHEQYNTLNRVISEHIDVESTNREDFFIQDYQLAMLPQWMNIYGRKTLLYWHIPFPKSVPAEFVAPLLQIVHGMLGSSSVGFHTQEYADNFMQFVETHFSSYEIDQESMLIAVRELSSVSSGRRAARAAHTSYALRNQQSKHQKNGNVTQLIVHPLGIDLNS